MPTITITRVVSRCPHCRAVLAVEPRLQLGSPLRTCTQCHQPVISPYFAEWEALSSLGRSWFYMPGVILSLFVGLFAAFLLETLLTADLVDGFYGLLGALEQLPSLAGQFHLCAAAALAAGATMLERLQKLRVSIRESEARMANPVYRLQLASLGMASPASAYGASVASCLIGLGLVGASRLFPIFWGEPLTDRLRVGMVIVFLAGALVLVFGLLGLIPTCKREQRYAGLAWVAAVAAVLPIGLYLFQLYRQGHVVPADNLLALLDRSDRDSQVRAVLDQLGAGHGAHPDLSWRKVEWPQHGLAIQFVDNGRVNSISFGLKTPTRPYQEALPYGLTADDGPSEVTRKLGPAEIGAGNPAQGGDGLWEYPRRGLTVAFQKGKLNSLEVRVPPPIPPPMPSPETLLALPGKDQYSPEFLTFRKLLGPQPTTASISGESKLSWLDKGVEVWLDQEGKVKSVFLHEGVRSDWSPYKGELPGKLVFGDSRQSVLQKLGTPSISSRGLDQYWNRGLSLDYEYEGESARFRKVLRITQPSATQDLRSPKY